MTQLERSIEPPGRVPFSSTRGRRPSSRARAAHTSPAMPAPATIINELGQRERRLVLDVLNAPPLRAPEEHRIRVRGIDDIVDLDAELVRSSDVLVRGINEDGEMVQQRLLGRARLPRMELDPRPADLDARSPRAAGSSRLETERGVLLGRRFRILREEGDVIEVVLNVGVCLDEPEPDAFAADVEIRGAVAGALDWNFAGELVERRVETRDTERDVLQRTPVARPFGVEQRDLPATRIRAEQREPVGAVDDMHADVGRDEVRDGVAVRDPVGDVIELRGVHSLDGTRRVPGYASSTRGRPRAEAPLSTSANDLRSPSASPRCR